MAFDDHDREELRGMRSDLRTEFSEKLERLIIQSERLDREQKEINILLREHIARREVLADVTARALEAINGKFHDLNLVLAGETGTEGIVGTINQAKGGIRVLWALVGTLILAVGALAGYTAAG